MKKKKGETLIESLLSMFFVVCVLVPVSNIFFRTNEINKKIDKQSTIILENENIVELLTSKKYREFKKIEGVHIVKNMDEFCNIFLLNKKIKDKIFEKKLSEKKEIEIIKKEKMYEIIINKTKRGYVNEEK